MDLTGIFKSFIEAIEARDAEAYAALYEQDAVMTEPLFGEPIRGRDAIAQSESALFDAFTDIEIRVLALFAEEGRAAAELSLAATNTGPIDLGAGEPLPATGRRVEVPMGIFIEAGANGLIAAERDYFDTASIMRQLGILES